MQTQSIDQVSAAIAIPTTLGFGRERDLAEDQSISLDSDE